ncbi:MAG: flippase [Candidatus Kerfeldbacteria bacterium]
MKDVKKLLIKGSLAVFAGYVGFKAIDLLMKILVGRLFGEETLGLFNLFISLFFVLSPLALIGMHMGTKRYIAEAHPQNKDIVVQIVKKSTAFIAANAVIISCLLFAGSSFIARFLLKNPDHGTIIRWFAVGLPFYALIMMFTHYLEGMNIVRYTVWYEKIIRPLVPMAGVAAVAVFSMDIRWLYIFYNAGLALTAMLFIIELRRRGLFMRMAGSAAGVSLKKMLSYSWPLMFHSMLYILLAQSSLFVIQYFMGEKDVGLYSAAAENAKLIPFFQASLAPLFFTITSRMNASKQKEEAKSLYLFSSNAVFVITLPVVIIFFLFARDVLYVTFGSAFTSTVFLLQVLAVGYMVDVIIGPVDLFLNSLDKTRLVMMNSLIALTIGIVLSIILVPRIGLTGAAVSTALAIALQNVIGGIELWWIRRLNVFTRQKIVALSTAVGLSLLTLLILPQLPDELWIRTATALAVLACYAAVLHRFIRSALRSAFGAVMNRSA